MDYRNKKIKDLRYGEEKDSIMSRLRIFMKGAEMNTIYKISKVEYLWQYIMDKTNFYLISIYKFLFLQLFL